MLFPVDPLRLASLAALAVLVAPRTDLAPQVTAPAPASAALEDAIEVDVRDLTLLEWQEGDRLPDDITKLDGRRVCIRGYMHKSVTDTVTEFPMVSDSCQCTGTLLPHHFVEITLSSGDTSPIPGEFEVVGKLSVGEKKDEDGFVVSLYRLSRASVL
ncbi:MAG: hypothetical protein R3F34_10825 [Planctomycetota bacterium]